MPAVPYRARTNRAHKRASTPRRPTSTHNTARAEEKRDGKEEEEKGEVRGEGREGRGKGRGHGKGKGRVRVRLVGLAVGGDALYTPLAASISSALALCKMVLASNQSRLQACGSSSLAAAPRRRTKLTKSSPGRPPASRGSGCSKAPAWGYLLCLLLAASAAHRPGCKALV